MKDEAMTTQPPPESAEPALVVIKTECWCERCKSSVSWLGTRMSICPSCGNKRCPRAEWHGFVCSGSNETGQVGVPSPVATDTQAREAPAAFRAPLTVKGTRVRVNLPDSDNHGTEGHIVAHDAKTPEYEWRVRFDESRRNDGDVWFRTEQLVPVIEPVTPAPAGDDEVSHEQARDCMRILWEGGIGSLFETMMRYIDQCESRQQQAEREVAERWKGANGYNDLLQAYVAAIDECNRLRNTLPATETEGPTCSGEWLSGSGGHRQFGGCGRAAVWVEHGTGAAFCDEHGPTFRTPPDQAPPAKPLTRDDVKAIARAVVAEVAGRAERDAVADSYDNARLCLSLLAEAAKEESDD